MLMYTSCGWFFDDLAGIETVQCLQYAARVCELCERLGGDAGVEAAFVDRLAGARSNLASCGDGRQVWREKVITARVALPQVVAHWATLQVLNEGELGAEDVYCYRVAPHDVLRRRTGKARLLAGVARVASTVTRETNELAFAVLHLGEHHLVGGVRACPDTATWQRFTDELSEAFLGADLLATQRVLDRFFGGDTFSLGSLFARERASVLATILAGELRDADQVYRSLYDQLAPLMRYLVKHDLPVPQPFAAAGEQVLRRRILAALERAVPSYDEVRSTIAEASQVKVDLDTSDIAYAAGDALHRLIAQIAARARRSGAGRAPRPHGRDRGRHALAGRSVGRPERGLADPRGSPAGVARPRRHRGRRGRPPGRRVRAAGVRDPRRRRLGGAGRHWDAGEPAAEPTSPRAPPATADPERDV